MYRVIMRSGHAVLAERVTIGYGGVLECRHGLGEPVFFAASPSGWEMYYDTKETSDDQQ